MRFWFLLVAALGLRPAAAQELTLEELVTQTLERNPEILVAQKKYEAARQRPSQASSLPDPMISPGWNSNGSPVPWAGLGRDPTSSIGFSITQEIPAPGKQRLRANVARKEADAQFADFESVQLNVLSRLKQAYFRLQHYYAAREVLEKNRKVLQSLLTITEIRYSAGKAAQQDVFKAQLQISLIDTKILLLDRERHLREAEINSLLNMASNTPLPKPGEPHAGPLQETLPDLQTIARERSPMRVRDQKMAERAETALNLARKDYYPDYAISGGYYNMAGLPAFYTFRADIKIPLYFRSKQRAEVTEQAIAVSQAKHAYEATGLALDLRIADDYSQADTAYQLVEAYRDKILPQAQLTVESSLASYQTGGVDFMSVLNNQTAALEYEMDSHEQMLNYHLAIVRLEEVTGIGLNRWGALMNRLKSVLQVLLIGTAFVVGRMYTPGPKKAERKVLYYVDPMHPAYKSDKPGIAPDCGMKLEPVYDEPAPAAAASVKQPPGTIQISAEKQQLIGVKFGTAEYTSVGETLRAVGKIAIDETRVVRVHPKVEGWIEHVNADFMGAPVQKGDPLLTVYSPEMLASEKEYLLAVKAHEVMQDGDSIVAAARKRLELWDLSAGQIDQLEQTKTPIQSITIYSPASGVITSRNSFANQRITPETELYAITDLSRVWVMADLFENDISKIQTGQTAVVKMPYAAGGDFLAKVEHVLPQVDAQTRTAKVRLAAANPSMKLRPDMFVDVEFAMAGARQLTVPVEAVLNAGSRQTVFVDRENGYLEPRAVETGDQVGDRIVIVSGLKQGERIVTSANFLIDSESQLKSAVSGMGAAK